MFDPDRYRPKDEVEAWKQRDPVGAVQSHLLEAGEVTDADLAALEAELTAELDDAVAFAEAGHDEPVEQMTRWVHSDRTAR